MSIKAQRIPSVNSSICKIFSKTLPSKIYHGRIIVRKALVYIGMIDLFRPQIIADQMVSALLSWRLISDFSSSNTLLLKASFFHLLSLLASHTLFIADHFMSYLWEYHLEMIKNTERFAVLWGDFCALGSRSLAHAEGASWKTFAQIKPFLQRECLWPGLVYVRLRHALLILAKNWIWADSFMIQIQSNIQIFSLYLAAFVKHCHPLLTAGRVALAHTTEQP